jgi:hypothetical protein
MENLLSQTISENSQSSQKKTPKSFFESEQYAEYLRFKSETDLAEITVHGRTLTIDQVGFISYCLWRIESDIETIEAEVIETADFEEVEVEG